MKKRYLILAGILAVTVAAAGCGKKADPKDNAQTPQATVAPAADDGSGGDLVNMQKSTGEETEIKNVMGTKTETAAKLVLVNKTGSDVASIYIRPTSDDDEDWGDELVQGMFTLKNGDKALYYYDKDLKDEDGNMVNTYDIRIVYTDEELSECFFRKIPLPTISEISLLMDGKGEDSIPYAEYVSTATKKKVSTLQEVKQRLGLTDDGDTDNDGGDNEEQTAEPTQEPADNTSTAPEPTEAPAEPEEPTDEEPSKVAESYIGKSLDDLIGACGEPTGHDYQNEPETGETGYHYYDTFTVSTTVDENGNEIVAGVW